MFIIVGAAVSAVRGDNSSRDCFVLCIGRVRVHAVCGDGYFFVVVYSIDINIEKSKKMEENSNIWTKTSP